MTIAYGIALSMDWEKPYWAAFAVAFVSLATIGQSMNKAALRLLGTAAATLVALILIALFAQDRWLFMLFLSAWLAFCTYRMSGSEHQYAWHVSGFVCVIICMNAGPNALDAFNIAMLRAQETGLGILVYSLIAVFLWPSSSGPGFHAAAAKLATSQRDLVRASFDALTGTPNSGDLRALSSDEVQARAGFDQLLAAAVTDDVEVGELRRQWRDYQRLAAQLSESLARQRDGFAASDNLEITSLLPDLTPFGAELTRRMEQVEGMLGGRISEGRPNPVELRLDRSRIDSLSPFQKAALAVVRARLQQLEKLSGDLLDAVASLKNSDRGTQAPEMHLPSRTVWTLDPDRATGVIRLVVTMWLAFLALIYVDALPGGVGFLSMACPIGMILATTPQMSVSRLFQPVAVGVLVGALVHIFLMPQLSSFAGLGLLIFTVTFAFCYVYAAPQQGLGRAFGLAMFVNIAAVSNEQSYSFLSVATTALMFPLLFLLLAITAYIPVSPRPERAFQRLLGRYFRSCEFLTHRMERDPQPADSWPEARKSAFHLHEVSTLPGKLGAWAKVIGAKAATGTSPQQLEALVASLQPLTRSLQALLREGRRPQAQMLRDAMSEDFRTWRQAVQSGLHRLSENPEAADVEAFRRTLEEIVDHLEHRIRETLDSTRAQQLGEHDGDNFYRLLGAYRGVSEALVDYADSADGIEWAGWREERFA